MTEPVSFPRQQARTQRFTLGAPRGFQVAADGSRVLFLRSRGGQDRATCLWALDVAGGAERLLADPVALLAGAGEQLSPAERARRERLREGAAGIVGYAADAAGRWVAFPLSGRVYLVDSADRQARPALLPTATPAVDPRLDPSGTRVAYVADGALRVVDVATGADRVLAAPDGPEVTWGLAEFVAAEEMHRLRGYWWSPDGTALLTTRVDEAAVTRWHLADPADPAAEPVVLRYPAAGTANAVVTAWLVDLAGNGRQVHWDGAAWPYLVAAHWSAYGPPLLLVQSRDQRRWQVLAVDPADGTSRAVAEDADPHWLTIVPGTPAWSPQGVLLTVGVRDGTYRLLGDGRPLSPPDVSVRAVLDVDGGGVLLAGSRGDDPEQQHLWSVPGPAGPLTEVPGQHTGRRAGSTLVVTSATLDAHGTRTVVLRDGQAVAGIPSYAQTPVLTPTPLLARVGGRRLATAVLYPREHRPGTPLPVLLDPYGGPGAARVVASRAAYLTSQWFADQGFAVVVVDGRGTPGRGPAWERAVAGDLAGPVLDDQVEALHALAAAHSDLDLSRVGIRGWSFGGYLAALAVLRRPDVFHAAVAGAPVTDWALYDTHYTERYLGLPAEQPAAYQRCCLLADAATLTRPLLLIHGLADDNVVAAHTLRLSAALLAAGRPHTVLPLPGVSHMTPQELVAENLLLLQVDFLRRALG
ncbi:MAG: prolyl oligopeptidase family serine peptidase [Actinomycetota bacterium]